MIPQRLEAMSKCLDELRDKLVKQARDQKITPEQAEAQARAAGLPPFQTKPEFAAFDPMAESRWTFVEAVAWIAWRDLQLVMEQRSEYRRLCTRWVFREWTEPVQGERKMTQCEGWVLEPWPPSTTLRLRCLDNFLRRERQLPASACLTPREAETTLWQALSESRLKAEGFDKSGAVVEIAAREWTHLKLFEESNHDAFKYDALDNEQPYTKLRLKRQDVLDIWPREGGVAKSEHDCRRWLVAIMRESPDERPKPKRQFQTEAQRKFRNLSERQFLRAWDTAVEEAPATNWSKRGRPKTKI